MQAFAHIRRFGLVVAAVLALAGCGGGGSSPTAPAAITPSPAPVPTPTPTATPGVGNVASVIVDGGPVSGAAFFNTPYVTITICAPGSTTNCQTIDHVILDTGSVGLRILQPVIHAALLAALPAQTDTTGNPVGECYQYVTSYAFGSVRQADFRIAGEAVAGMPFQVVAGTGVFAAVPDSCSSGGGAKVATVADLAGNAILGIGTTLTDCGTICQTPGNSSAASYYDCPTGGCQAIIARAASVAAPFQQLPNPVAAFAADNNGTLLTLPAVPQAGQALVSGTLTFGIGTQSDNALTATRILTLTTSQSNIGPGLLTATYQGKALPRSFLDTGSGAYYFIDSGLTVCNQGAFMGFYCPAIPVTVSVTLTGQNNAAVSAQFTLSDPRNLANTAYAVPGLGIDPQISAPMQADNQSFGVGLPFYFGRTVYTALEGVNAGGTPGPYVAF